MTPFELNTHARLVAIEHLVQNLYYMHYRAQNATREDISVHHERLLNTVVSDLRDSIKNLPESADPETAISIADGVEAQLSKNLMAIRSMWVTTPRTR